MLEIIIQGRGGQGAQTAGNLLAMAFFSEGKYVQAFATYGGARRGTPVSSFIRIDDKPIRRRCNIEHPDAILCFDDSLLNGPLLTGADDNTMIVVNTSVTVEKFKPLENYQIYPVDGNSISQNNGLGRFVNSALLGAFIAVLKAPEIDSMRQTISESAPVKKEENVNAFLDGYNLIDKMM